MKIFFYGRFAIAVAGPLAGSDVTVYPSWDTDRNHPQYKCRSLYRAWQWIDEMSERGK